jgi:hypothetical protein
MDAAEMQRLLGGALGGRVEVRVKAIGRRRGRFTAEIESQPVNVEWLSAGWPRQVNELLDRPDRPDLVVASELSPGAQSLLTRAGLSWVDLTGAAHISIPGVTIILKPGRDVPVRRASLGWTAGALAVCEGLLVGIGGTVAELAEATGLAPSTVATALKFLQGEHLLEASAARGRNARRTVVDQDQLLDAYAAAAARLRIPESIRVGVLWRDMARGVRETGEQLATKEIAWSVTGALAADVLAPYLIEADPWEMYLGAGSLAELRQIAREVGLSEATGGRLLLRPFPTPAGDALSTAVSGQRVVAWPRAFADLRMIGVRGEEAAEHLREHMRAGG